jgi:uncharacterized protein YggE
MFAITSVGEGFKLFSWIKQRNNFFKIALVAVLLLLIWFWYSNPLVVTVTGSGEVQVQPDKASIYFVISDQNIDPKKAIDGVKAKLGQFKTVVGAFGVAPEDIIESQIMVNPPSISGSSNYVAALSVNMTVSDITKLDSLVATLYSAGASYVSQPLLVVSNYKSSEDKALELAIKDASAEAVKVGKANWKLLKKKVGFVQTTSLPSSASTTKKSDLSGGVSSSSVDTFKITTTATVTYKMW